MVIPKPINFPKLSGAFILIRIPQIAIPINASTSINPTVAASGANLIVTDVWSSMGQEQEQQQREEAFEFYQVSESLLDLGADDVIFMHCLPAHRGEEISEEVLVSKNAEVSRIIKPSIPVYHTRAMKKQFYNDMSLFRCGKPAVLREMYKRLTGMCCSYMC